MRRVCDFKKLKITLWPEFFLMVVWILSQFTAFVLKLQQKNLHGQKSTVWKSAIIPQYLNTRMLSIIFSCGFFLLFSTSLVVVSIEMGYQYVSSLTQWTIVPNSKIENCDCLFMFLLIKLEMRSSSTFECTGFVCFFRKLCVWKKSAQNL